MRARAWNQFMTTMVVARPAVYPPKALRKGHTASECWLSNSFWAIASVIGGETRAYHRFAGKSTAYITKWHYEDAQGIVAGAPAEVAAAVLYIVAQAHGDKDAWDDDVAKTQHGERRLACTTDVTHISTGCSWWWARDADRALVVYVKTLFTYSNTSMTSISACEGGSIVTPRPRQQQLACCRVGAREEQLDRRVQALSHADHDRRTEHPKNVVKEQPAQQQAPCTA